MNVFECALTDQFNNNAADILWLNNSYGEPEEMPVEVFFRDESEMPEMELYALGRCRGAILDIGAGEGSHSLVLQQEGFDVISLEISTVASGISKQRGVKKTLNLDIFTYHDKKFDTLLMLMNGIGLAGTLPNLPVLLNHCKKLLRPGGQIIFDSSDISYLYDDIPRPFDKYFGEISYQYEYKNQKGEWFNWLYLDKNTLRKVACDENFSSEIIFEDGLDQYLACLTSLK
ncbi:MAG: methyltransferase domain-containing protein [Sphingobacteriaceae bacterium]|nr:methyltransferase domain-containing protein [Sphingobacteriaceae bacterium]